MPGSILIAILSAVASHLVLLTLVVFVVVGLQLFGGQRDDAAVPPVESPATVQSAPVATPTPVEPATEGDGGLAATPGPIAPTPMREAKSPKLIGGSLPVYPRSTDDAARSEGFRPPDDSTAPMTTEPVTYEERIQAARRAYWNGEFEVAEAVYLGIVTDFPDDADAFGELGNLYEAMGERDLAKDAYFAAGQRLQQSREFEKLLHVVDWLEKKGDSRAEQLSGR